MTDVEMAQYPNLTKRENGRYYLRMRVPADLVKVLGEYRVRSLGTSDFAVALPAFRLALGEAEREYAEVRADQSLRARLASGSLHRITNTELDEIERQWWALRPRPLFHHSDDSVADLDLLLDNQSMSQRGAPGMADFLRSETDWVLIGAGYPSIAKSFGKIATTARRVDVDRTSEQYRYLMELVRRRLAWDIASKIAEVEGEPQPPEQIVPAPELENSAGMTVAQMIASFRSEREFGETDKKYKRVFQVLTELVGPDKLIASISRSDCIQIREFLRRLPAHTSKKPQWRELTLRQIAASLSAEDEPMAGKTLGTHMSNLAAVFNWAKAAGHIAVNPASGLSEKARPKVKRRGFEVDELRTIFEAVRPHRLNRPERYWVPLLAAFTGARANELCQLYVEDVLRIEDVACLSFTLHDTSGRLRRDVRLKTEASERLVPLHKAVLDAGFLAFVEQQKRAGEARLFPRLRLGANKRYSDAISRWFGPFLDGVGYSEPNLVFHSFRHAFANACRRAQVGDEAARALCGWTDVNQMSEYGDRSMVPVLNEAMQRTYPGLVVPGY